MNFPILIGVSNNGIPCVGAKSVRNHGCKITEKVYAVQLKHRVVGMTESGWHILTPTDAKKTNAKHICKITGFQNIQ